MSAESDLRFGRVAVTKSFLTEDVLTEILIHQAAEALQSGGVAKPLYQVAFDGGWLEEDQVQAIRLAARFQEFLEGEKELADLVVKHGIAGRDLVEEILNRQKDLWKQTQGKPPGLATMLADEASLGDKEMKALRTLESRLRKEADRPTLIHVVMGPAAMPSLPAGMAPPATPTPATRGGTKSGKAKCPSCKAPLPSVRELHCDACGALFCPQCRGVVKAEDVTCWACGVNLRAEEPEPKSKKGLIAAIVVVVVLAGAGGVALAPGPVHDMLFGKKADYTAVVTDVDKGLAAVQDLIDKEKAEEAKDALAKVQPRIDGLDGKIAAEEESRLKTSAQLKEDAIAKLEKRLDERRQTEEAAAKERERREQADSLVAQAAKAKSPDDAVALLQQSLKLLPENGAAWALLGEVLDKQGKRDEATKLLGEAAGKKQLGSLALVLLGRWAREGKDYATTRKWLNAVFSLAPSADLPDTEENKAAVAKARYDAHRMMVLTEMEDPNGNAAEAINHFREMGTWSDIEPELLLRIAELYRKRDETTKAVDLYQAYLKAKPDSKRRLLLEWRMRRLTKDASQEKADLVVIKEAPKFPYFFSKIEEKQVYVKNLPTDADEVALPAEACEVKREEKNPLGVAFDMYDKRMGTLSLDQVGTRVEKMWDFINEATKNGVPPAVIKAICEAELSDLPTGNDKLADLRGKVEKWTIPPPSVKPPAPESIGPQGGGPATTGTSNPSSGTPTAARTFDADKVWNDLFGVFKRGKEKFGDPSKQAERLALDNEAMKSFQAAIEDGRPTESAPAKKWFDKGIGWLRAVTQAFMGDEKPKEDWPNSAEAGILSNAAATLVKQCIQFAAPPQPAPTPEQAFDSLLTDLAAMRKAYPGTVRFYVVMVNGQKGVSGEKSSGLQFIRREGIHLRIAQFEQELSNSSGGHADDTVKLKEKCLATISQKLPAEMPLDKFNYDKYTAIDPADDMITPATQALDRMIERARK